MSTPIWTAGYPPTHTMCEYRVRSDDEPGEGLRVWWRRGMWRTTGGGTVSQWPRSCEHRLDDAARPGPVRYTWTFGEPARDELKTYEARVGTLMCGPVRWRGACWMLDSGATLTRWPDEWSHKERRPDDAWKPTQPPREARPLNLTWPKTVRRGESKTVRLVVNGGPAVEYVHPDEHERVKRQRDALQANLNEWRALAADVIGTKGGTDGVSDGLLRAAMFAETEEMAREALAAGRLERELAKVKADRDRRYMMAGRQLEREDREEADDRAHLAAAREGCTARLNGKKRGDHVYTGDAHARSFAEGWEAADSGIEHRLKGRVDDGHYIAQHTQEAFDAGYDVTDDRLRNGSLPRTACLWSDLATWTRPAGVVIAGNEERRATWQACALWYLSLHHDRPVQVW